MTRQEAVKLVAFAAANFPGIQEKDMRPTAALWQKMLEDIPYEVVEKALIKVLTTTKHWPTVAEIREAAASLTNPALPSAAEAWGEVVRAIEEYGYYREAEALAALSLPVRKVVECIGWQEICACEEADVIRGQFRRMYEAEETREKERAVLPEPLKQLIGDAAKKLPEPKPLRPELPPVPEGEAVTVAEIEALIRETATEDIAARNAQLREALARMDAFLHEKGA